VFIKAILPDSMGAIVAELCHSEKSLHSFRSYGESPSRFMKSTYVQKSSRIRYPDEGDDILTATRVSAASARCQTRSNFKAGPVDRFHEIDANRFGFFKEILVNRECNAPIREGNVFSLRLIQSHAQRGPASGGLYKYSDGMCPFLLFQEVLEHTARLFRYFKHNAS